MDATTDMTLVAYLACQNIFSEQIEVSPLGQASWLFAASPALEREAKTYLAGRARVEPKQFHMTLAKVRRQMQQEINSA